MKSIHVIPVAAVGEQRPHQEDRGCWCGPEWAVDCRGTLPGDDLRIFLHRGAGSATAEALFESRVRKGAPVRVP